MNARTILSTVIELLGLTTVIYGASLICVPVAVILGGLVVLLLGVAIDPPAGKAKRP